MRKHLKYPLEMNCYRGGGKSGGKDWTEYYGFQRGSGLGRKIAGGKRKGMRLSTKRRCQGSRSW